MNTIREGEIDTIRDIRKRACEIVLRTSTSAIYFEEMEWSASRSLPAGCILSISYEMAEKLAEELSKCGFTTESFDAQEDTIKALQDHIEDLRNTNARLLGIIESLTQEDLNKIGRKK